jgi:DNA-binding transcriptional MerR regulator
MARKYFRISEVVTVCSVTKEFILSLEQERVITSVTRKKEKVYPLDQVDRIRVAHNLMGEMGVNLEGVEVALHMREQIMAMRRELARMMSRLPKQRGE